MFHRSKRKADSVGQERCALSVLMAFLRLRALALYRIANGFRVGKVLRSP